MHYFACVPVTAHRCLQCGWIARWCMRMGMCGSLTHRHTSVAPRTGAQARVYVRYVRARRAISPARSR